MRIHILKYILSLLLVLLIIIDAQTQTQQEIDFISYIERNPKEAINIGLTKLNKEKKID